MKKYNYIEFEVDYSILSDLGNRVSDIMSKMDLGIDSLILPQTSIYSWKTTTKVNSKYIEEAKKLIIKAIENEGGKVLNIKLLKAIQNL